LENKKQMSNRHQALEYSEQYTINHTNEASKANEATQRSETWFKDRYGKNKNKKN